MILLQFGNENVVSRSLLANSAVPPHNKEARVCHPSKRRVDQQSLFMSSYDKFSIFTFFIVAKEKGILHNSFYYTGESDKKVYEHYTPVHSSYAREFPISWRDIDKGIMEAPAVS